MVQISDNTQYSTQDTPRKVLRMVTNERTAGSMPSWGYETNAAKTDTYTSNTSIQHQNTENADRLSYRGVTDSTENPQEAHNEFKFRDFLDMINPLQHIPVVNIAYRAITHDEIKPIGEIIGGAIFGGPVGAASGLVNTIIREETGKDLTGNLIALVRDDDDGNPQITTQTQSQERAAYEDLPASLLAFAEMPLSAADVMPPVSNQLEKGNINKQHTDKYAFFADERTAGKIFVYS